jgi:hypothetical protein
MPSDFPGKIAQGRNGPRACLRGYALLFCETSTKPGNTPHVGNGGDTSGIIDVTYQQPCGICPKINRR